MIVWFVVVDYSGDRYDIPKVPSRDVVGSSNVSLGHVGVPIFPSSHRFARDVLPRALALESQLRQQRTYVRE